MPEWQELSRATAGIRQEYGTMLREAQLHMQVSENLEDGSTERSRDSADSCL